MYISLCRQRYVRQKRRGIVDRIPHGSQYVIAVSVLLLLPLAGLARAAGDIGVSRIERILADWQQRREVTNRVMYVVLGNSWVLKGAYTGHPELPEGVKGPVPTTDYRFEVSGKLIIDFENQRSRRETAREVFHLQEMRFIPDVIVDLFDGRSYQTFCPRDRNSSLTYSPPKYQPELSLKHEKVHGMYFRSIDYPILLAHGVFPRKDIQVTPQELMPAQTATMFRDCGVAQCGGRDCVLVRTEVVRSGRVMAYEGWVDMGKLSAVLRFVSYVNGREIQRLDIDYKQIEHGWFPASWARTEIDGPRTLFSDDRRVTEISFAPEINNRTFHIQPVPGMVVYDYATGQRYVKADPGQPDTLISQDRGFQDHLPRVGRFGTWVLTSFLVVVVVAVLLVLRKRRR